MSSPPFLSLSQKVLALLQGDAYVTSVIGAAPLRAWRMRAPQGTTLQQPYLIIWFPTHQRVGHLRGITDLENPVLRFDYFGTNLLQLEGLRNYIIKLLCAQNGSFTAVYRFGTELYEDDTRLYHLLTDFTVWHDMDSST